MNPFPSCSCSIRILYDEQPRPWWTGGTPTTNVALKVCWIIAELWRSHCMACQNRVHPGPIDSVSGWHSVLDDHKQEESCSCPQKEPDTVQWLQGHDNWQNRFLLEGGKSSLLQRGSSAHCQHQLDSQDENYHHHWLTRMSTKAKQFTKQMFSVG